MRSESAEVDDLGGEGGQNWIDGREDGAAVSSWQKELGDGSHDEHFGLGFDLLEAAVQGDQVGTVEHLGSLHAGPRGNDQAGHISTNIRIADNGK